MTMTSTSAVLTPEDVLQQLRWRYATKAFDPTRKISGDLWQVLEQSLVLAPSSFGLQPWKFFVITDPTIRQKLLEYSNGQTQVVDASHLVVLSVKTGLNHQDVDRHMQQIADVRNVSIAGLEGFANVMKGFLDRFSNVSEVDSWSTRQVYIVLGQFMTCAAMLGVDTCPMEGFQPDRYDEVLGLKEQGYHAVVLCPAGYRAPDDAYATKAKVRFPTEAIVEHITA